jgi:hypothetical protein
LPLLPSLVCLQHPNPSATCPFLFLIHYSGFFCLFVCFLHGGDPSVQGLCWFIPGVVGGIPCDDYLLTCWSARCLPSRFGASVWQRRSPPFFSVTWPGEALYGLGFRVSKFWFFLVILSAKCCSSLKARFLIYGAHAVCFCTLIAMLDRNKMFVLNQH